MDSLIGDASKAERLLGWKPLVLTPDLARLMVDAGRATLQRAGAGHGAARDSPA